MSKTLWLLLLVVPLAYGSDLQIQAAEIVGFGTFTARQVGKTEITGSAIPHDVVEDVEFTDYTNEIPATLGTEFGFQYIINSSPVGRPINVTYIIRFPEPGLVKPSGKVYKEARYTGQAKIGRRSLHGYGFDEAWEIVPGKWVFEVWYRKARLIRKTFTVVESAPQ